MWVREERNEGREGGGACVCEGKKEGREGVREGVRGERDEERGEGVSETGRAAREGRKEGVCVGM